MDTRNSPRKHFQRCDTVLILELECSAEVLANEKGDDSNSWQVVMQIIQPSPVGAIVKFPLTFITTDIYASTNGYRDCGVVSEYTGILIKRK